MEDLYPFLLMRKICQVSEWFDWMRTVKLVHGGRFFKREVSNFFFFFFQNLTVIMWQKMWDPVSGLPRNYNHPSEVWEGALCVKLVIISPWECPKNECICSGRTEMSLILNFDGSFMVKRLAEDGMAFPFLSAGTACAFGESSSFRCWCTSIPGTKTWAAKALHGGKDKSVSGSDSLTGSIEKWGNNCVG